MCPTAANKVCCGSCEGGDAFIYIIVYVFIHIMVMPVAMLQGGSRAQLVAHPTQASRLVPLFFPLHPPCFRISHTLHFPLFSFFLLLAFFLCLPNSIHVFGSNTVDTWRRLCLTALFAWQLFPLQCTQTGQSLTYAAPELHALSGFGDVPQLSQTARPTAC